MREQRVDLAIDVAVDVLDVIDLARLEAQQGFRPVGCDTLLGKEEWVARRDDACGDEQSGVVVVGVDPIRLPGIVSEHDVGAGLADDAADRRARREGTVELAVDVTQQHDVDGSEDRGGVTLFLLALRDERGEVGVTVPGSLGTIGAHADGHVRAGSGPFCERRTAPEFDIVGVGTDRERSARDREVDRDCHFVGVGAGVCRSASSASSAARSAAVSTSNANAASRRIRTVSDRRDASPAWRAAESGP